eukprot:jgi/Botrbrau1/7770/Bobra.0159s0198.1
MSLRRWQWCVAIFCAIYAVHVSGELLLYHQTSKSFQEDNLRLNNPTNQARPVYMAAVQAAARPFRGRQLQQVVNINGSPVSNPCVTGGRTFCPIIIKKLAPIKKALSAPAPGPQQALAAGPQQALAPGPQEALASGPQPEALGLSPQGLSLQEAIAPGLQEALAPEPSLAA